MQKLNEMAQMVKNKLNELTTLKKDTFANIPPYDEKTSSLANLPSDISEKFKKHNINSKELYYVIAKFDLDPKNLTADERNQRKKYLEILKTVVTSEVQTNKGTVPDISKIPYPGISYEELSNLLLRTVDLFIKEVENVDAPPLRCPTCPECKNEACPECKKEPCPTCPECKKEPCPKCPKCPPCPECLPCVVYPTCPSFMGGEGCGLPTWLVVSVFILFVICLILIRNMYIK